MGAFLRLKNVVIGDDLDCLRFALTSRAAFNAQIVTCLLILHPLIVVILGRDVLQFEVLGLLLRRRYLLRDQFDLALAAGS